MTLRYLRAAKNLIQATLLRRVKYLILHVTPDCNSRCRFCFNADGMRARSAATPLTLDNIRKLAKGMRLLPQLTLSGGEPTLRDDIAEILDAFYRDARTRFFTIASNALRPDRVRDIIERFVEQCPRGFLNLCLPFHGEEPEWEAQMGVPGTFDKFRQTYDVIQQAKKRHKNISGALVCVLNKFNHHQYRAIIDFAHKNFDGMPLGMHFVRGVPRNPGAAGLPVEAYQAAYAYEIGLKRTKSRSNPFTVIQESIQHQMQAAIARIARGETANLDCKAGKNLLVIYDDGAVYPCEMIDVVQPSPAADAPSCWRLGHLRDFDYDLNALLKSPAARSVLDWLATHDCACTWECAVYSKIVNSPSLFFRLGLRALWYMLK